MTDRGWFIVPPAPPGRVLPLSQAPTQPHATSAQLWSSLATNQTQTEHTTASLMAFPPRSGRCFGSGPGHAVSKHRPWQAPCKAALRPGIITFLCEMARGSTAVVEKCSSCPCILTLCTHPIPPRGGQPLSELLASLIIDRILGNALRWSKPSAPRSETVTWISVGRGMGTGDRVPRVAAAPHPGYQT